MQSQSCYLSSPRPAQQPPDIRDDISKLWGDLQENNISDLVYCLKDSIGDFINKVEGAPELLKALEDIEKMADELDAIEKKYRPAIEVIEGIVDFYDENGGFNGCN